MKRISKVTVTYDDDTTETWSGRGTCDVTRTGTTRSNMLQDHNLYYVTTTLKFEKEAPGEG